ncbi:MAG TPA: serine hydrolase [Streptosporangiaceae bacterium]|jgi:CubicO group peptidase (beta-lactamase class C family)|nr:serine hydrolase [Streptosporangiaceae bacterium]
MVTTAGGQLMAGAPPFPAGSLVNLGNWQDPPYNRWAFQHVRELIPTARIRRGDGAARRLPRAERDLSGIRYRSDGRELTVREMLAESYTDGFLVLHRGRIVTEQYFNGMRPDTPHLLMSVSKSVVSSVAGVLAGQGRLDVSAPVATIVPELGGTSFAGATVQHLLDMRAGTRFDENYDNLEADVRTYERVFLWRPDDGDPRPADALAYYATLTNDGPHGGPFRYRSILTDVLGWVIERAGGARLHELISELIWQPMGAEFDAEITLDAHGNPMADGGVCATLRDLGRFGLLFAGTRRAPSSRWSVMPASWVLDTIAGAADGPEAFIAVEEPVRYTPGMHYRNCWWVTEPAVPFFYAAGINGQQVFVHQPSQVVVVKLSTWPSALNPVSRLTIDAVLAIAAALQSGPDG